MVIGLSLPEICIYKFNGRCFFFGFLLGSSLISSSSLFASLESSLSLGRPSDLPLL